MALIKASIILKNIAFVVTYFIVSLSYLKYSNNQTTKCNFSQFKLLIYFDIRLKINGSERNYFCTIGVVYADFKMNNTLMI